MKIIADSSAILSLFFPEKQSEKVEEVLLKSENILTLDLAYYEITNAIRKRVVKGEIAKEEGSLILEKVLSLVNNFEIHSYSEVINDAYQLSLKENLTVYDASFLALTLLQKGKLMTVNEKLINAIGEKYRDYIT